MRCAVERLRPRYLPETLIGRAVNLQGLGRVVGERQLNVFAKETGGAYYPITFDGDIPSALKSINALLRSLNALRFAVST